MYAHMHTHVYTHTQCHSEAFRLAVQDFDMFAGIERNKIDVKNPLPTRCVPTYMCIKYESTIPLTAELELFLIIDTFLSHSFFSCKFMTLTTPTH